jgi:hypothetical protein
VRADRRRFVAGSGEEYGDTEEGKFVFVHRL